MGWGGMGEGGNLSLSGVCLYSRERKKESASSSSPSSRREKEGRKEDRSMCPTYSLRLRNSGTPELSGNSGRTPGQEALDVFDLGAVAAAAAGVGVGLLVGVVRGPEGEVVPEELHDQGGVLIALFAEGVEFGDGVVEGLFGDVAGSVGGGEDFVVEDGEVEGEAEADGVGRRQGLGGDRRRDLVRLQSFGRRRLSFVGGLEFREVSVVVALHLVIKHLALVARRNGDELVVDYSQYVLADLF
mmetsp:Transcript_19863/g.63931  ORF Transcript_19863/g.63931 Transcript_19863/m.63931 type:complete len:243 (+) Transcript_19863:150-878(+)